MGVKLSANNPLLYILTITETEDILNANSNNDGVEVTMDGQETERIVTLLGESLQEALQLIRLLVMPNFTTVVLVNWNVCTIMYATGAAVQEARKMREYKINILE